MNSGTVLAGKDGFTSMASVAHHAYDWSDIAEEIETELVYELDRPVAYWPHQLVGSRHHWISRGAPPRLGLAQLLAAMPKNSSTTSVMHDVSFSRSPRRAKPEPAPKNALSGRRHITAPSGRRGTRRRRRAAPATPAHKMLGAAAETECSISVTYPSYLTVAGRVGRRRF
jgi:hypothetical protein